MAKKKKKVKSFDPLGGYIATSDPTQPIIKEQFGVPTATTTPSNVPIIQSFTVSSFSPVQVNPILNAYGESLDVGDTVIYILTAGTTLMLTGFILSTTGLGAITENNETTLWVCVSGGDSGTGTSRRIGFVPVTAVSGASNIVQITFPIPIALNGDIWATINMNQQDTDTHDRAQIFGYLVNN